MEHQMKLLRDFSRKLGISSPETAKKALELLRLAEVKCGAAFMASIGGNDSCRIVVCLELAAAHYGVPIDKAMAAKLSGLTKRAYTSAYKALEQQLQQKKHYSLKDLAVQFGCMEVLSLAEEVLKRYKEKNQHDAEEDHMDHLLFPAAALFATSKFKKTKIDKNKLQALTGVKKSMFEDLVNQMEETVKQVAAGNENAENAKRSRGYAELLSGAVEDGPVKPKQRKSEMEGKDCDYEEWKRRILANARKYKEEQNRKKTQADGS